MLTVEESIFFMHPPVGDGPETGLRAIVPCGKLQEILEQAHGSRVGGHFGIQKKSRET